MAGLGRQETEDSIFSQGSDMYDDGSDMLDGDSSDNGDFMEEEHETEILFKVLKPQDIFSKQQELIGKVTEIMEVSPAQARVLLQNHRWDIDALQNEYFTDPEAVLRTVGLSVDEEDANRSLTKADAEDCYMCGQLMLDDGHLHCYVCHENYEESQFYTPVCGHTFCRDCMLDYLRTKIEEQGLSKNVTCPAHLCGIIVGEDDMADLLKPDQALLSRYQRRLAETFVEDNPHLKWCPAPNCGHAIQCSFISMATIVKCACGARLCFNCVQTPHAPATCHMVKEWKKKCSDDSETAHYLSAYTKDCPKCQTSIEKNGGCNHMNCSKCQHHFCWQCLGDFDHRTYNHTCNKFEAKEGEMESKRAALERYMHYYTRFTNHMNSLKMEEELLEKMRNKMVEMQNRSAWIDVQFLKTAADLLTMARERLAYSYVVGFYLPKEENKTKVFEFLQNQLEMMAEKLSGMLEQDVDDMKRMHVVQQTDVVRIQMANFSKGLDDHGMLAEPEPALGLSTTGGGSGSGSGSDSGSGSAKDDAAHPEEPEPERAATKAAGKTKAVAAGTDARGGSGSGRGADAAAGGQEARIMDEHGHGTVNAEEEQDLQAALLSSLQD